MRRESKRRFQRAAGWLLAAVLLGLYGGCARKSVEQLKQEQNVKGLVRKLQDEDAEVRQSAMKALEDLAGSVEDEARLRVAVPPLLQALQHQDEGVRLRAAFLLVPFVPLHAAGALERIGTPEARAAVKAYRQAGK